MGRATIKLVLESAANSPPVVVSLLGAQQTLPEGDEESSIQLSVAAPEHNAAKGRSRLLFSSNPEKMFRNQPNKRAWNSQIPEVITE